MSDNRRSKILIVDDVPESALITKSLLAKGNFVDVEIASGGYEALEKCGVSVDSDGKGRGRDRFPVGHPRHRDAGYRRA